MNDFDKQESSTLAPWEYESLFQGQLKKYFNLSTAATSALIIGVCQLPIQDIHFDSADETRTAQISQVLNNITSNDSESKLSEGLTISIVSADETTTSLVTDHDIIQADRKESTTLDEKDIKTDYISQNVKKAINNAQYLVFESGMENSFSKFLNKIVAQYGDSAIKAVSSYLGDNVSEDIIVEAIKSLGEIEDSSTKTARFGLILTYLNHISPILRDAAALAFADIGDKGAISYLKAAAEREKYSAVRYSFLSVAKELEDL